MNQQPETAVSIVLPTHDGARFVRQTLDSLYEYRLHDGSLSAQDDAAIIAAHRLIADSAERLDRAVRRRSAAA